MTVKLIYRDGHAEEGSAPEPRPVLITMTGSKCGKVRARHFRLHDELTEREAMPVYMEVEE